MIAQNPALTVTDSETAALRVLAYFAVFKHPLTAAEVFLFSAEKTDTPGAVSQALEQLAEQGKIFRFDAYYQAADDASWVPERLENNRRAATFLQPARRMARLIEQFPFVRGVFVSGSLSKHCMGPDSDVDFFIVTEPGRLWLARTLLVLFKKVFLLNSHRYFCVNYFVDTGHLEIEEKNIFTATEAVTLLPLCGREYYEAFHRANPWVQFYYPHYPLRNTAEVPPQRRGYWKRLLETMFSGAQGAWLDRRAMRFTVGYWRKKFRHLSPEAFDLALKSQRGVSKHHPLHFQEKVLRQFDLWFRKLTN